MSRVVNVVLTEWVPTRVGGAPMLLDLVAITDARSMLMTCLDVIVPNWFAYFVWIYRRARCRSIASTNSGDDFAPCLTPQRRISRLSQDHFLGVVIVLLESEYDADVFSIVRPSDGMVLQRWDLCMIIFQFCWKMHCHKARGVLSFSCPFHLSLLSQDLVAKKKVLSINLLLRLYVMEGYKLTVWLFVMRALALPPNMLIALDVCVCVCYFLRRHCRAC